MLNFRAQALSTDKMAVFDISSNPYEKSTFFAFFCENIWSCQKKAVLLHAFLKSLGSVVVLISLRSNDLLPARLRRAGSSSARLECLLWEQEVVSSNLAYPTGSRMAPFL